MKEPPSECHHFYELPTAAALNSHVTIILKYRKRQMKAAVTLYCQAVIYLFETYESEYVFAETKCDLMPFTQLLNKLHTAYTEKL